MDAAVRELRRNAGLRWIVTPADARIVGIGRIRMMTMGEAYSYP
jgi:hypothetical protein